MTTHWKLCTTCLSETYTTKVRVFAGTHYISRIDYSYDDYSWAHTVIDADVYVISDYNKGSISKLDLEFFKGKKVIVDPKKNLDEFKGMWCIKPSRKEFEVYAGTWSSTDELLSLMQTVRNKLQITNLIVTLDKEGAALSNATTACVFPTTEVEVSDVTGAGDTFTAVLAYGIDSNFTLEQSIRLAIKASSEAVKHYGTYQIQFKDLELERIVFTNGCFDILHPGHMTYLEESKKLGTKLIVGLNSDRSISELKGPERPINTFADRKAMLEKLPFVDEVIEFDEITPLDLIKKVKPDIITKGGDYKAEDVVGYGLADVVILPFIGTHSSTNIINRIKK